MALLPRISVMMLIMHGCHSYILLTANLDDVHAIAKQIANSPVAGQLNSILRRASTIFNQQLRTRNNDGHPHHSPRANPQESYSSSEPVQDNHIARRNLEDQAPHHRFGHHHRRSGTGEGQNNNQKLSQKNLPERFSSESETKDRLSTSIPAKEKVPSDHRIESRAESTHENNDEKSKSAHQNNEELHDNLNHQKVEHYSRSEEKEARVNEHPRKKGDLTVDKDERNNMDEVVALGKNASFYLNSMKKIMENI